MRDISVSFATTGVIQVVNIATGLLAARLLLPEGRGELAAILLWPGLIAELGVLGLSDALLYAAATRLAPPRVLFASIMTVVLALSVVLTAIGVAIVPYAYGGFSPEVRHIATLYMSFIPIYYVALFMHCMFQGHLAMMAWNFLRLLVPLGYIAFILIFWLAAPASVGSFALANVVAHVAAGAVALWVLIRRGWFGLAPQFAAMKAMVVYGVKVHLGEMLNTLRQRLDQALVALFLSATDLGLYAVALTVANGSMILIQTAANVAFPKISQQDSEGGKIEVFGRYLRAAMLVSLTTGGALMALSPWLVPLLFGEPFRASVPVIELLLLGLPALAVKLMLMQALKAWNRSLVISRGELAGLIVAAVSLAILLPRFGLLGAAGSLLLAQIAAAIWMGASLWRDRGIAVLKLLRPTLDDWQRVTATLAPILARVR